tara:strand:- start:9 stop:827 length:819 start_codon:yes stop_codon:yes gene_type:complete
MSQKQANPVVLKIVKNLLPQLIPNIDILLEESYMIDYYKTSNDEPKLVNNYKKYLEILPKTPTYSNESSDSCDCIEISDGVNRVVITSALVSCIMSDDSHFTRESYVWKFTKENQLDFYTNLNSKTLNSYCSNTRIKISDFNKVYKFSLAICMLDEPMNCNIANYLDNSIILDINISNPNNPEGTYLHHDSFNLTFYSDKAFHPHSETMCICKLSDLGTENCPYTKYINKKSTQQLFQEITDELHDSKESFEDNKYLNIMNNLMELKSRIKS